MYSCDLIYLFTETKNHQVLQVNYTGLIKKSLFFISSSLTKATYLIALFLQKKGLRNIFFLYRIFILCLCTDCSLIEEIVEGASCSIFGPSGPLFLHKVTWNCVSERVRSPCM